MRISSLSEWELAGQLSDAGYAELPGVLSDKECGDLFAMFRQDGLFRSTVNMSAHRFGEGTYRYFRYPLPKIVERLRVDLYRMLAPIANTWGEALGIATRYPSELQQFLRHCHRHQQVQPTPLLLYYEQGGANAFHQDNYGKIAFPLQVVILLSEPKADFAGGAFLLREESDTEEEPRVIEVSPGKGDAIVFPNRWRPDAREVGSARRTVKHGVAVVAEGRRMTLGIIFHDARVRRRKSSSSRTRHT